MRDIIIDQFTRQLSSKQEVKAFFEAGSAAFLRNDEYSDIDMGIVVEGDYLSSAVQFIDDIMQGLGRIDASYILSQPTWHGHWQGFFHIEGTSPYLLLDILIIKESSQSYLTEIEEHGKPIVYFDKTGKVGKEHIDFSALKNMIPRKIDSIRFITTGFRGFVEKEILRGRLTDAMDLYYNMFLRSLSTLLRIKYDTTRFSFGNRYLIHILPEDIYKRMETLFFVCDTSDLYNKQKNVLEWMDELLKEDLLEYVKGIQE